MVMTRSMAKKQNFEYSLWSDLNHDVLYLVMMRLAGVVEYISFSGVCKSWRSVALFNGNRKRFMGSQPPMRMWCISNAKTCHLQDFRGRKFKTMIPQLVGRECVGVTCGYLILFGKQTRDFWLVNPITRHELHFPGVPFDVENPRDRTVRSVLVFSPSLDTWVFFMTRRLRSRIWFSIAGKRGAWNHVRSAFRFFDLLAFKGKIYTLNLSGSIGLMYHICEMRLNPVPKITVIDMHFRNVPSCVFNIISTDENLYLMERMPGDTYKFCKLGFEEMICAPCEKAKQEYVLFQGCFKSSAAVKPESWAAPSSSYVRFFDTNYTKRGKDRIIVNTLWYFPHACLNVDLIDE